MRRDQNVFFNVCTSPADQHIYPFVFLFFIIFGNCCIYLQINTYIHLYFHQFQQLSHISPDQKSTFTLIILCKLRRRSSPILTANENIEIWKFTLPFRINDTLVVDLYLYFKILYFDFYFLRSQHRMKGLIWKWIYMPS